MKKKILVSACLLGEKVRYHGGDAKIGDRFFAQWNYEGRLISFCPEVGAGMPSPRPPSEITEPGGGVAVLNGVARIKSENGTDVTATYLNGAHMALALAFQHQIPLAILKEGSPSCGSSQIYDGTFRGNKLPGAGVTAALLIANGIKVFSENEIAAAHDYFISLTS